MRRRCGWSCRSLALIIERPHHNPTHKARNRPVLARRSRLKPRLQLRVNRYVVKLADGSSTVEGWGPKGWTPGGASFGEIFDAPPVGRAFASELGIPLSDLGYSPARSEAEWDDVESKLQIAAGKRLLQRLQPGRA